MSEHTPTLESVKELAVWAAIQHLPEDMRTAEALDDARRRFGRTIAAVERAAAEKALTELAESYVYVHAVSRTSSRVYQWLKNRADAYRRNEGENE